MFSLPFRAMLFLCVSLPLHAFAFHRPGLLFLCCASRTTAHLFRCHALSLIALPLQIKSGLFYAIAAFAFRCHSFALPIRSIPINAIPLRGLFTPSFSLAARIHSFPLHSSPCAAIPLLLGAVPRCPFANRLVSILSHRSAPLIYAVPLPL